MKERRFKIGDRVRIRPDSQYSEQCSEPGVVIASADTSSSGWIRVKFDNDYQNSYPDQDLYLDEPIISSSVDQEFAVGDMIQVTQGSENWDSSMSEYVGKIGSIKSVTYSDHYDAHIYKLDIDGGTWNWWPSKGHFIHAPQLGLDQKDELLYRAEQMFPVGTRFSPAHVSFDKQDDEYCIMTDDSVISFGPDGSISATIHDGENWDHLGDSKYGNTRLNRVLYYKPMDRWATVVKESPKFKVGDKVMITEGIDNWCLEMNDYIGKIATLTKVRGSSGTCFTIDLDNGDWAWSDTQGHFRMPTKEELATITPELIKYKYKIGDVVMLTQRHHAVDPQKVTISQYSEVKGKPAYVLQTWSGRFPEHVLSSIEEHEAKPTEDFLAMAELKYPVGTKYKCATGGEYVYTVTDKQSFSLHDTKTVYGNPGQGCLYKDGKWAKIVESVTPKHKFNVGDWVVGNSNANRYYSVTKKGWTGQVTKIENRNSSTFMSVQGKYNSDNSHYDNLNVDCFDLITEDECDPRVEYKPAPVSMSDISQIYTDSKGRIRYEWSTSAPVVKELPTFRVKKVSFNRI